MTVESGDLQRFDSDARLSKAVVANGFAFLAGMTARDRSGGVREQTADILEQIDHYLGVAGTDKTRLVSVNIWLKDIGQIREMNEVWIGWVAPGQVPARATVQAQLASDDILVEIMVKALV
jgi:enamine deaminase RidA (YjgF/YER057c/UK114 family)